MKKTSLLLAALSLLFACKPGIPSVIKTDVPPRPSGQEDMLQFAAAPIADVGIGIVGLGMRGGPKAAQAARPCVPAS